MTFSSTASICHKNKKRRGQSLCFTAQKRTLNLTPMPTEFDASDFVDSDFQPSRKTGYATTMTAPRGDERPPTREEVDSRVNETQSKLAELKRAQEELERELKEYTYLAI